MLSTILVIILILILIGALPRWSHSANWGYGPSGGLTLDEEQSTDRNLSRLAEEYANQKAAA